MEADGRFLVTTCTDGSAQIWDASTGHLAVEPFSHEKGKEVRRAACLPPRTVILTKSQPALNSMEPFMSS